jgi:hypothetical protein
LFLVKVESNVILDQREAKLSPFCFEHHCMVRGLRSGGGQQRQRCRRQQQSFHFKLPLAASMFISTQAAAQPVPAGMDRAAYATR